MKKLRVMFIWDCEDGSTVQWNEKLSCIPHKDDVVFLVDKKSRSEVHGTVECVSWFLPGDETDVIIDLCQVGEYGEKHE